MREEYDFSGGVRGKHVSLKDRLDELERYTRSILPTKWWSGMGDVVIRRDSATFDYLMAVDPNNVLDLIEHVRELQTATELCNQSVYGDWAKGEYLRCGYQKGHKGPHWANGQKWMEIDPQPGSEYERALLDRLDAYREVAQRAKGFIENMVPSGPNAKNIMDNALIWLQQFDALEKNQP